MLNSRNSKETVTQCSGQALKGQLSCYFRIKRPRNTSQLYFSAAPAEQDHILFAYFSRSRQEAVKSLSDVLTASTSKTGSTTKYVHSRVTLTSGRYGGGWVWAKTITLNLTIRVVMNIQLVRVSRVSKMKRRDMILLTMHRLRAARAVWFGELTWQRGFLLTRGL